MEVSHRSLIITAAAVWVAGGMVLVVKGGSLLKDAYLMEPRSLWAIGALFVGIAVGLLKGKYLFSRSCKKNINRIKALAHPRIWQCFSPGMLIFLALIMPAGAWMSSVAAGNYPLLCLIGALDLSIALALLTSSTVFWKLKAC